MIHIRMGVVAVLALLAVTPIPGHAQGNSGWIGDMLSENPACLPEVADRIGTTIRRGIERDVARVESSITPPAPVAELSCLGQLMRDSSLDVAFPTQSTLSGNLQGFAFGLIQQMINQNSGDPDFNPANLLSGSLCTFAADRWNQATPSLDSGFQGLAGMSLPGNRRSARSQQSFMRRILGIDP